LDEVGFTGLVVEDVDLGAGVVDDHDVVQAVAIDITDAELADLVIDGENFPAAETEAVEVICVGASGG
jgi:hypothetical protein